MRGLCTKSKLQKHSIKANHWMKSEYFYSHPYFLLPVFVVRQGISWSVVGIKPFGEGPGVMTLSLPGRGAKPKQATIPGIPVRHFLINTKRPSIMVFLVVSGHSRDLFSLIRLNWNRTSPALRNNFPNSRRRTWRATMHLNFHLLVNLLMWNSPGFGLPIRYWQ